MKYNFNLDLLQFINFNMTKKINNLIIFKENEIFLYKKIFELERKIEHLIKIEHSGDIGKIFSINFIIPFIKK